MICAAYWRVEGAGVGLRRHKTTVPARPREGRCDSGFGDAQGMSTRGSPTGVGEIDVQCGWNGLGASVVHRAIAFASREGIG